SSVEPSQSGKVAFRCRAGGSLARARLRFAWSSGAPAGIFCMDRGAGPPGAESRTVRELTRKATGCPRHPVYASLSQEGGARRRSPTLVCFSTSSGPSFHEHRGAALARVASDFVLIPVMHHELDPVHAPLLDQAVGQQRVDVPHDLGAVP